MENVYIYAKLHISDIELSDETEHLPKNVL